MHIPGVVDTPRVRWRRVHSICVCSFTLRMLALSDRVLGPHRVRNTRSVVFPNSALVIAGDANVWLPHFRLNRLRSNAVFPYIQQLLDLGLTIINPQSRATHVAGAALDLVFVSTHLECGHFTVSVLRCAHVRLASRAKDVRALLSRALSSIVSRAVAVEQLFDRLCEISSTSPRAPQLNAALSSTAWSEVPDEGFVQEQVVELRRRDPRV